MTNKQYFILTIVLFFLPLQNSHSQNSSTIGIKGGIISNRFMELGGYANNIYESYSNALIKPVIGISAEIFKSKYFMLMPEVFYHQKGAANDHSPDYYYSSKPDASYLSFIVSPAFRYSNRNLTPYIFSGLAIDFLMKNNLLTIPGNFRGTREILVGFTAGAGIEKALTKNINITADARYNRDLTGFTAGLDIGGEPFYKKNVSFEFLIGLNYKIGNK